ncbi:MAG: hypothetical protein IJ366_03010 [Clostridia bacterium]|nr:hypothetical protein [Clostridia bacterium]
MKKLLAVILCAAALTACGGRDTAEPTPTPTPTPVGTPVPSDVRTMITPSQTNPIKDNWTTLGEVGVVMDGEYTDIILATEAQRGGDGYMMWDDSQRWALVAVGEDNTYTLFDENMGGTAYIEVAMEGDSPAVNLVTTATVGLAVTKFTYSDGAFYAEELVTPEASGNEIYSSFPEYFE